MANIFILLGHPDKNTTCGSFATSYEQGAKAAGHEVRRINLGDLKFDPILHKGYHETQLLEPDLLAVQENFKWANHIVIFYPNWWSSMPALLKGMFDRMFLPNFAFHFNPNHMSWKKLLTGRSARVVVTMDNWPFIAWLMFGDYTNEISRAVLGFAGVHPVRVTKIGPILNMSEKHKKYWHEKLEQWGRVGK
ncbi:MAG: NAD(P)H-dependent oxidoreductase [Patescibacteria group bacterium]